MIPLPARDGRVRVRVDPVTSRFSNLTSVSSCQLGKFYLGFKTVWVKVWWRFGCPLKLIKSTTTKLARTENSQKLPTNVFFLLNDQREPQTWYFAFKNKLGGLGWIPRLVQPCPPYTSFNSTLSKSFFNSLSPTLQTSKIKFPSSIINWILTQFAM